METLAAIEKQMRHYLRMNYNGLVDGDNLKIEFSDQHPADYENNRARFKNTDLIKIDGYYCDYQPELERVVLYMAVIKKDRLLFFDDDLLVRLCLWEKVGNWLTHTISFHTDTEQMPKIESYKNCGEVYRDFCSSLFTSYLVKDSLLLIPFDAFSFKTSSEYGFAKQFMKFNGVKYKLPGLSKPQMFGLIQEARKQNRYLTRDFIMDFFDDYIDDKISQKPPMFKHFCDYFSEKQKAKWAHLLLSGEFGFFDD